MKKFVLIFIKIVFIAVLPSMGQNYNMPSSGSLSITTCSGVISDNGGPTGDYSNNYLGSITINPSTPGTRVSLNFTSFSIENNFDFFYIYDGVNTSAPIIGQFSSNPGTINAINSSGALTIQLLTDASNQFSGFEATISCISLPECDLITRNGSASPSALLAGNNTTLSCEVVNQGETHAISSNVGYYLSTNNSLDASDVYLGSSPGGALAFAAIANKAATLLIPANTLAGNYFVFYKADFDSLQLEYDENNNVSSFPITILASTVDLRLHSLTSNLSSVANGSIFSITASIENGGTVSSPSSNIGYYLSTDSLWDISDNHLGNSTGGILANGSSANKSAALTIPGATAPGNYYLLFFADNLNAVIESNEANNIKWLPMTVSVASVDIQIQSLTATNLVIPYGGNTTLSYILNNTGNSIIGLTNTAYYLSSDSAWDISDTLLSSTPVPSLTPNLPSSLNATVTIYPNTPAGNYYILLLTDYLNTIPETDETNNFRGIAVTVVPSNADLVLKTAEIRQPFYPQLPFYTPGLQVDITCKVFNQGNVKISSSNTGYYYSKDSLWDANDILLNYNTSGSIDTNVIIQLSSKLVIPASAFPGDNYILFYTDFLNNENETNETNNIFVKKITIAVPTVELSIEAPEASPSNVIQGNILTLTGAFKNSGTFTTTNSALGFYLSVDSILDASDTFLEYLYHTISPISSSNINSNVTIPSSVPVGNYYILYYADYINIIPEINELDNIISIPITIISPTIDLTIQSPSLSIAAISPGGTLTVTNKISNAGNIAATTSNTGYYLSLDNIWDASDTYLTKFDGPTLNPLGSYNQQVIITLPTNVTLGSYYLLFYADYSGRVAETNELNNIGYVPFRILNEYQVPLTGNRSIATCSGLLYDNGGIGNYSNNSNGTLTIYPEIIGNKVALNFNSFNVDFWSYDGITIYDGNTTLAPVLGTFNGYSNDDPTFYTAQNSEGILTVKFSSDYSDTYSGFDATISCLSSTSYSDLTIISSLSATTSTPPGSPISINTEIKNQGANISSSSDIAYYLSLDSLRDVNDVLITSTTGAALTPDKSSNVSISLSVPYNTAPGLYYILPYVDYLNNTLESNELNNSKAIALTVTPSNIDLTITFSTLSPSVFDNQSLVYNPLTYAQVRNQGLTAASGIKVGYFLSNDTILDGGDTFLVDFTKNNLTPGNSESMYFNLTIPANTPNGNYYILCVADYLNTVFETNETNNVKSRPFAIVNPNVDLVIQSPGVTTPTTIPGNYIYVNCNLVNQGTTNSKTHYLGYYFSSDSLLDGADTYLTYDYITSLAASNSILSQAYVRIPIGTPSGNYYILFVADYTNVIVEANELNNVRSIAITVATPFVDLVITNVASTNNIVIANGNSINITNYLSNKGNSVASASTTGYYLSTDSIWNVSDVLLSITPASNVNPLYLESQYGWPKIPSGTPNGNYYIIIFADHLNTVVEANESNNAITHVAVTVTPQYLVPTTGSVSILACEGILQDPGGQMAYTNNANGTFTINPGVAGNFVGLRFTIFNLETCCDYIIVYDGPTTSSPVIATQYGSNVYGFLPGPFFASNPSGALTIEFRSNGTYAYGGFEAIISCEPSLPLADLITETVTVPTLGVQGRNVGLYSKVKNQGIKTATTSNVGYYLSIDNVFDPTDILLNNNPGGAIASGMSTIHTQNVLIPASTIPGPYYIIFVADNLNTVVESDESNNVTFAPVTILPATFDLVINTQYVYPTIIPKGTSAIAVSNLTEVGTLYISSSNIGYYLSTDKIVDSTDVFLNSKNVYNLHYNNNDLSSSITIPIGTPVGDYYILFMADYTNTYAESQEANNTNFFPITVIDPSADLTISTAYISNTNIVTGFSSMSIFLINNIGSTIAPKSSLAYYLSSDNLLDPSDISLGNVNMYENINGNSSLNYHYSFTIPGNTVPGNYYLLHFIDNNNIVPETNENNNVYALAITVVAPSIDFIINTTTISVPTIIRGQSCYLSCKIYNQESTYATTSYIGYYLSTDSILDLSDTYLSSSTVYELYGYSNASESGYPTIPSNTIAGQYYILFVADYLNAFTETNETNNVAYMPITVSSGPYNDLIIQNASLGPITSTTGGFNVNAYGSFYNNGISTISNCDVAFYISNDNIYDGSDVFLNSSNYPYGITTGNSQLCNKNLFIPNSYVTGNYYLIYVADYLNKLNESDEANNVLVFPIYLLTEIHNPENVNGDIVVYPNPSSGVFQLKINNQQNQNCNVVIYNSLGIEVTRREISHTGNIIKEDFYLTGITSGLYTIKIEIGDTTIFRKLVIEK